TVHHDIPDIIVNRITPVRSPRVRAITFLPCNCCIYYMELVQYRTSFCFANSSIPSQPYMQFLFVSSGFCLRLPSDSVSRQTPVPLANSVYCQSCSRLSTPSYSPCLAHLKKGCLINATFFTHLNIILRLLLLRFVCRSCLHRLRQP